MDDSTPDPKPAYVPPTEEKKAFLGALAAAQGAFLPIVRNRQVSIAGKEGKPGYSFKYAELSEIIEKTRPALSANGLSLRSAILPHTEPGHIWLQSILGHVDGYQDIVEMSIAVAGDIKLFGGQLSYLRRYMASGRPARRTSVAAARQLQRRAPGRSRPDQHRRRSRFSGPAPPSRTATPPKCLPLTREPSSRRTEWPTVAR
jgi:hypothetical protein